MLRKRCQCDQAASTYRSKITALAGAVKRKEAVHLHQCHGLTSV